MIDNIISTIGFELFVFMSILIPLTLVLCCVFVSKKPKIDKQMAVLDAYIDSVAKANDLITVSLPINNRKVYEKIIKKLQQDFLELREMIGSVRETKEVSHGNFVFKYGSYQSPTFKERQIYDDNHRWVLSPAETLSLMKEWPEAKLEILKIHKKNILDFNHIVNELAGYIT